MTIAVQNCGLCGTENLPECQNNLSLKICYYSNETEQQLFILSGLLLYVTQLLHSKLINYWKSQIPRKIYIKYNSIIFTVMNKEYLHKQWKMT